jgi:hypothetical protein
MFNISKYPDTKIVKETDLEKQLKQYFPGINSVWNYSNDSDTKSKSFKVTGKALPGLKKTQDGDTQSFDLRDYILNISKKGFTVDDSIESVNDGLMRIKMGLHKKSPFVGIDYDDYIKQVEDEVLAHIVQGDEFKNLTNIGEFLYLGDEEEILGEESYAKEGEVRGYMAKVNSLIKDSDFVMKGSIEKYNEKQAINSTIHLLRELINKNKKFFRRNANPSDSMVNPFEKKRNDRFTLELNKVFDKHLSLFFNPRGILYEITLKPQYKELRIILERETQMDDYIFDNFSNYYYKGYIVVADDDSPNIKIALYNMMDYITKSIKLHGDMFNEMNNYFKLNKQCLEKSSTFKGDAQLYANVTDRLEQSTKDTEEKTNLIKEFDNLQIKIITNFKKETSDQLNDTIFEEELIFNEKIKNITKAPGSTSELKQELEKLSVIFHQYKQLLANSSNTSTSQPQSSDPDYINKKLTTTPNFMNTTDIEDHKKIAKYILVYLNQIKYRIQCIFSGENLFGMKQFYLEQFDKEFQKEYDNISSGNDIKTLLLAINNILLIMERIYRNANDLSPDKIDNTKNGTVSKLALMNKTEELRTLKDNYEELKMKLKIDGKLYNKRFMLAKKYNEKTDALKLEYESKYEKNKSTKEYYDHILYEGTNKGVIKAHYKPTATSTN